MSNFFSKEFNGYNVADIVLPVEVSLNVAKQDIC